MLGVPADSAVKECGAGGGVLTGEDFGVGQARVIVDGDVQVLPPGVAVSLDRVFQNALADHVETAKLLGVDMDELAGRCALVADDRVTLGAGQS